MPSARALDGARFSLQSSTSDEIVTISIRVIHTKMQVIFLKFCNFDQRGGAKAGGFAVFKKFAIRGRKALSKERESAIM